MSNIASNKKLSVSECFKNMDISPAVESSSLALAWILKHQKTFCGFAEGKWLTKETLKKRVSEVCLHKITDPFTREHIYDVYVSPMKDLLSSKVKDKSPIIKTAASKTFNLYNVAKTIERNQKLLAGVEAISSGKHFSKVQTKDVPNIIESFYYYAGYASHLRNKLKPEGWFPIDHVCIIADEYNDPCLSLCLQISSILAAGNSVTILADMKSCLSAFLLAEICCEAGVPDGVIEVFPIDQHLPSTMSSTDVSKILLTSSFEHCQLYSALGRSLNIHCEFLVSRRPVIIVYKHADLHSAAEGVIESFIYHDTRSKSGGCKLMIEQSVAETFLNILEEKFSKILVGGNFSKTDMSCIVTEDQKKELEGYLIDAEKHAKIIKSDVEILGYNHIPPTLIKDVQTGFKLVHEELGGPIAVVITFRTVKESISMFNCDNKGSPVSIWTDNISVALEVAYKLKTGTVWVNTQNIISTKTAFSGVYFGGNSVAGGMDAFYRHLRTEIKEIEVENDVKSSKIVFNSVLPMQDISSDMIQFKFYIGGKQKCSDKIFVKDKMVIYCGSETDVSNAISSGVAALSKWELTSRNKKIEILHSIIEILVLKREELICELELVTKLSVEDCNTEFSETMNLLHYWVCQADYHNVGIEEVSRCKVLQSRNPLGVIGFQCSNKNPLLSFMSLLAPAISFGNVVIAIINAQYAAPALEMCEILTKCGVPDGVINVISGNENILFPYMCKHKDVNAIWYTDIPNPNIHCNQLITQKAFDCRDVWIDFNEAKSMKLVMASTFIKSVFLPNGEIFAN